MPPRTATEHARAFRAAVTSAGNVDGRRSARQVHREATMAVTMVAAFMNEAVGRLAVRPTAGVPLYQDRHGLGKPDRCFRRPLLRPGRRRLKLYLVAHVGRVSENPQRPHGVPGLIAPTTVGHGDSSRSEFVGQIE